MLPTLGRHNGRYRGQHVGWYISRVTVYYRPTVGQSLVASWPICGRYLTTTVFRLIVGCHFVDGSLTDHLCTTDTWSTQPPIPTSSVSCRSMYRSTYRDQPKLICVTSNSVSCQIPWNKEKSRHWHCINGLLMQSSKTNYERTTGQLTIWLTVNDCITVTIDGLKCTNDITSLHSQ